MKNEIQKLEPRMDPNYVLKDPYILDFFPNPCWHPYGEFFTAHCRKNAEIGCQSSAFPQRYLTTP